MYVTTDAALLTKKKKKRKKYETTNRTRATAQALNMPLQISECL